MTSPLQSSPLLGEEEDSGSGSGPTLISVHVTRSSDHSDHSDDHHDEHQYPQTARALEENRPRKASADMSNPQGRALLESVVVDAQQREQKRINSKLKYYDIVPPRPHRKSSTPNQDTNFM
jgi:hypothetical protein